MSSKIPCWMYIATLSICLPGISQQACATNVPITFEEPTYSTTADIGGVGVPGSIHQQDGWGTLGGPTGFGVGEIVATDQNPIAGGQSLRVPARSGGSGAAQTRAQASGLFTDVELNPITPSSLSWLVRIDNPGATNNRAFESGIATDLATAATPLTMIFTQNGFLQYYNGGNVNFPGDPTYTVGTVYRVEVSNISDNSVTYDAAIYDHDTDDLVASVTAAALQVPIGNAGVYFYVLQRGLNAGAVAMIDNITAVAGLPGDFNHDGVVDSADYVVWRKETPEDSDKYEEWRSHFGDGSTMEEAASLGTVLAVPEPATLVLIGLMIPLAARRSRLRPSH